jgi:hypothetical protein
LCSSSRFGDSRPETRKTVSAPRKCGRHRIAVVVARSNRDFRAIERGRARRIAHYQPNRNAAFRQPPRNPPAKLARRTANGNHAAQLGR